jgi:holo-[acyl-carrier protein] synthase
MGSENTGIEVRVGADLVAVRQVSDSLARFGDRYLRRIFTEREIAACAGLPSIDAARLAARFAAKEATIKVLRPADLQPDWRSIEVCRHSDGHCSMSLSGHAAALATQAGIAELAVSLTHEEGIAAAVVIALCRDPTNESRTQQCELLSTGIH